MLHEVLLALSGHPSPIFAAETGSTASEDFNLPLLTEAEKALLRPLGRLATLHRNIRKHSIQISETHPSTICRAVSTAIVSNHLARFQNKILEVERAILTEDAGYVGAYGIVPLATIVAEFEGWTRTMSWCWDLVSFILPVESENLDRACSGANLIDRLRNDALTGYPDIELCATELGAVAERAWLRQLFTFLLYGRLPDHAPQDFSIRGSATGKAQGGRDVAEGGQQGFQLEQRLIPSFVTPDTSSSILFIGKFLNQLQRQDNSSTNRFEHAKPPILNPSLLSDPVEHLSKLRTPISAIDLSEAIRHIRLSLSRSVINEVLPLHRTLQTMSFLRKFLLLGREDFAEVLVRTSEKHLKNRIAQSRQETRDLAGIVMKEGEVASVLAQTWSELEGSLGIEDSLSSELEWGRQYLHLTIQKPSTTSGTENASLKTAADRFNDFLLSSPTAMIISLPSHHDLVFSKQDIQIYSCIHSYMISIRRAHIRLTELWRQDSLRRSCLKWPASVKQREGQPIANSKEHENYVKSCNVKMRSVWATTASAVSILSTLGQYLNGEVIEESWKSFYTYASMSQSVSMDPEILIKAHRKYLQALLSALLLNNASYTRILRNLLLHCDQLTGLIDRLQGVWRKADIYSGVTRLATASTFRDEEADVEHQLKSTMTQIQNDIHELTGCLKIVDDGGSISSQMKSVVLTGSDDFKPWSSEGTDRLLMRIDQNDLLNLNDEVSK